jgi:hypothetical protein
MIEVKMTCPKWHFGQIGQGARKPYGGFFYQNSSKKSHDFL